MVSSQLFPLVPNLSSLGSARYTKHYSPPKFRIKLPGILVMHNLGRIFSDVHPLILLDVIRHSELADLYGPELENHVPWLPQFQTILGASSIPYVA